MSNDIYIVIAVVVITIIAACGICLVLASNKKKEGFNNRNSNRIARVYTKKNGSDIGKGQLDIPITLQTLRQKLGLKSNSTETLYIQFYDDYIGFGSIKLQGDRGPTLFDLKTQTVKANDGFIIPQKAQFIIIRKP